MSSLFTKCCCTGDCFWGWNSLGTLGENYGFCSHNTTERLHLRIPRPAYSYTTIGAWPATIDCPCSNDFKLTQTANGDSDIIVKYAHFPGEGGSRLYNWKWYAPPTVSPPCQHSCWGYDTPGYSDDDCCEDSTSIACTNDYFRTEPFGTSNFPKRPMSPSERDVIKGVSLLQGNANPPTSARVSSTKNFGNGYRWLDNIANYQTGNIGRRFFRYWYDPTSGWTSFPNQLLVESMFAVVHRTKWWKRDFNSMGSGDVAACRTPEYWEYECAGFPIYTWEVYNAPSSVISESEKRSFFTAANAGTGFNQSAMDRLVAYLGCEPKDHGRGTGETVKRTLVPQSGSNVVHYGFSREAGWKYVCRNADTPNKFPQWSTGYSPPNFQCDVGGSANCFTAGPFPQTTTCSASAGLYGPASCLESSACNPDALCNVTAVGCSQSNQPVGCLVDTAVGDCSGIWFHFNQYCDIPPSLQYQVRYACCIHNEAFLCVVPDVNSVCDCSTFPFDGPTHPIPPNVSDFYRLSGSEGGEQCCGGRGTWSSTGGIPYCDKCDRPNNPICDDPENSEFCS